MVVRGCAPVCSAAEKRAEEAESKAASRKAQLRGLKTKFLDAREELRRQLAEALQRNEASAAMTCVATQRLCCADGARSAEASSLPGSATTPAAAWHARRSS